MSGWYASSGNSVGVAIRGSTPALPNGGVLFGCVLTNYKNSRPLGRVGEGLLFFSFYLVKLNLMLNPKSLVVVGKLLFANSGVLVCRS